MSESLPEDDDMRLRRMDLRYMHRPPRIVPNYGRKTSNILPKSSVPRVLLYDNVTQQQMLDVKLSTIKTEQQKTGRLLDLHRKSFLLRRLIKRQHTFERKTVASGVLNYLLPILLSEDTLPEPSRQKNFHHRSAEKCRSSRVEEFQLPDIGKGRSRKIAFQQTPQGVTTMLQTLHSGSRDGRTRAMRRTILDKRFQGLENLLVHLEEPSNGYIELSPSYQRDLAVQRVIKMGVLQTRFSDSVEV